MTTRRVCRAPGGEGGFTLMELLLVIAILCSSAAFVGVMMLVDSIGRTEKGTRGAGFATLMPMSQIPPKFAPRDRLLARGPVSLQPAPTTPAAQTAHS